jgi:hypothetical protein
LELICWLDSARHLFQTFSVGLSATTSDAIDLAPDLEQHFAWADGWLSRGVLRPESEVGTSRRSPVLLQSTQLPCCFHRRSSLTGVG